MPKLEETLKQIVRYEAGVEEFPAFMRFMSIKDFDVSDVLNFIQKYGVLGIQVGTLFNYGASTSVKTFLFGELTKYATHRICRYSKRILSEPPSNLAFILEDEFGDGAILELRLKEIGMNSVTQRNVESAIELHGKTGDIYSVYFLDMQVPESRHESPVHMGGLAFRDYLTAKGVNPKKIFLMSGIISHQDEAAAREYEFDPKQIVGKHELTEKFLRELLKI